MATYRKYDADRRRFYYTDTNYTPTYITRMDSAGTDSRREKIQIPPPNVEEPIHKEQRSLTHAHLHKNSLLDTFKNSILDIFKGRIRIDDIILLGLIFILINEGIQDEILLIVLVYLFLSGRE